MFTHDPYMLKAVEYLVGLGFIALFVAFWQFVNGEAVPQPALARQWGAQLSEWFRVPDGFAFHPGHGWARPHLNGTVTVGIDDFAQQLVGPVAAVHLPKVGTVFTGGERGWSLEVDGKKLDVLAPVSGKVVALNEEVLTQPALVNEDPYGRGWLLHVQPARGLAAIRDLMSPLAARRWMEQVANSLSAAMTPELGHVYQDGGVPVHGLARSIDEAHWDDVARRFLQTT